MDKKTGSPFGDNDLAPILQTPHERPEEMDEDEYLAQYGPPFGPCGHPCACDQCQTFRRRLKEAGPSPQRIPAISRDEFTKAIEKVLACEPRDEWRETIRGTRCFARCWHDEEDHTFCTEMECDLRGLCETTWEGVRGGTIERDEDDSIIAPANIRMIGGKLKKGAFPKPSVISRGKWKGTGKYDRVPYVDQNRPVDKIAHTIWTYMGCPASLPDDWSYPISHTKEQEEAARIIFINVFGTSTYLVRRSSYHQYISNGYHLLRIWMNGAGGSWVDVIPSLSKILLSDSKNMIEKTPTSGKKTKFRFYPYRVYLSKPSSIERFKYALTQLPEFEYLSKGR